MIKVFSRLIFFILIVLLFFSVPQIINLYSQSKILPKLTNIINPFDGRSEELKVQAFKFKLPLGLGLSEFSLDIVKENGNKFTFSGDELALKLVPSSDLLHGKVKLKMVGSGILLHPIRTEISNYSENGVNYIQLVARKFENIFICDLKPIYESGFSINTFKDCYQKQEINKSLGLNETYYEIFLAGEKRSLLLQEVKDSKITLSDNHLLEINSLFREPVDIAQKHYLEEYPLNGMLMLLIKKYAEEKSRDIENKNRYQGINVNLAFFYYMIAKEISSEHVEEMISYYKLNNPKLSEETLSSALLGKLAFEQGIKEEEFLTPLFFNKFSYRAYNVDDESKVTEVTND